VGVNGVGEGRELVGSVVRTAKKISLEQRLELVAALLDATNEKPPGWSRMMTPAEVASLSAEGHEIGSHSMTHCLMPECDDDALRYEVSESRRVLTDVTGVLTRSFCYPNGDADARCAAAVESTGYGCAVTTTHGLNGDASSPYRMSRIDMNAARMTSPFGQMSDPEIAFRLCRPASA
jgi:peptidoglycan/xylan/chitin deacetylase (PgdA/CDA1 family)